MKPTFLFTSVFIFCSSPLWACWCDEPTIEEALQTSTVVVLGEIIKTADTSDIFPFYSYGSYGFGYVNLKLLKSYRGPEEDDTQFITVFDESFYTSCGGVFHRAEIGDTILIFGNHTDNGPGFTYTSHCRGTKYSKEFGAEETVFLNRKHSWITPKKQEETGHPFVEAIDETIDEKQKVKSENWPLYIFLAASLALNIFLLLKKRSG